MASAAIRLVAVAVAVMLFALPALAQQQGPARNTFGIGASPAAETAKPASPPGLIARMSAWVSEKQAMMHRELSGAVRRFKSADPISAALFLAMVSFAYGVLHAVGPGHHMRRRGSGRARRGVRTCSRRRTPVLAYGTEDERRRLCSSPVRAAIAVTRP